MSRSVHRVSGSSSSGGSLGSSATSPSHPHRTTRSCPPGNMPGSGQYPMPSYLRFVPGGVLYEKSAQKQKKDAGWENLSFLNSTQTEAVIQRALRADQTLHRYALLYASQAEEGSDGVDEIVGQTNDSMEMPDAETCDEATVPHFLPSLAALAEAAFGSLTGVPESLVKKVADAMVLEYGEKDTQDIAFHAQVLNEEEILNLELADEAMATAASSSGSASKASSGGDLVSVLKRLHQESQARTAATTPEGGQRIRRPCGYVFRRGDIAWNCRTCQADATCVLCDNCFHNSDHEGHEIFFHRTTPGGCCDCGDAEAWKSEGCCPEHRPNEEDSSPMGIGAAASFGGAPSADGSVNVGEDDWEAIRSAARGKQDGQETLKQAATELPPRMTAALAVVIGAAVNCAVNAVDGAGIGSDPVQWTLRWADQVCRSVIGTPTDEAYYLSDPSTRPDYDPITLCSRVPPADDDNEAPDLPLPRSIRLHLRLHNDDVHTFDEVNDALHEPRTSASPSINSLMESETDTSWGLVMRRSHAEDMTHHVDSDGQVTVRSYATFAGARSGYRRMKSRGLHCAVVSTPQVDLELRARKLVTWLGEISAAHPAAAALVVHALLDVSDGTGSLLANIPVWGSARALPSWAGGILDTSGTTVSSRRELYRRRFDAFPPHLESSYLTREEAEKLYSVGFSLNPDIFGNLTGSDPSFYSSVSYHLPSERYRKSPHALWGTMCDERDKGDIELHPLLPRLMKSVGDSGDVKTLRNKLTDRIKIVDTDLRKQQEADKLTSSIYPHKLSGLQMVSGVGTVSRRGSSQIKKKGEWIKPKPSDWSHLLLTSSFRAPVSPLLLLLLLDPYPTKQLRGAIHALFLSLLVDSRFKCRFAGALGGVAYRPLSTLFCAGVGTEADTPLGFTVQIFTAGSLVRALGNPEATKALLASDELDEESEDSGIFTLPLAHTIVRCIHTNLLGATKEVMMVLKNTDAGNGNANDEVELESSNWNNGSDIHALTYQKGEHPLTSALPAAPDDGFLDSRSTRHKRLPHLLRDLEYIFETPSTAMRLLLPTEGQTHMDRDALTFPAVWARLLRLTQGMDPQKRKISGGHVEYELNRWLDAFGLSLNFAGTRDSLAESPTSSVIENASPTSIHSLESTRQAMGNLFIGLLREMKLWLYREELLETGLPLPAGGGGHHVFGDLAQIEALQRSTLHVSNSQLGTAILSPAQSFGSEHSSGVIRSPGGNVTAVALSCATGIKMTEAQLELIEEALRLEQRQFHQSGINTSYSVSTCGVAMGDWLRVPHSPLAGDSLSFHLPLHRSLARNVRNLCSVTVPENIRSEKPEGWWKLPVLDDDCVLAQTDASATSMNFQQHPLAALLRAVMRSSNCRVVWSSGPDCTSAEAQQRRSRSRSVSALIASAKIIHSLADHPLRCLAAAQQIERHLWARNGSSASGMALNYGSAPLCHSFRDLDLTMVQLSAAGLGIGLGARRVFALLTSRFSMDGYLCDPERRVTSPGPSSASASPAGSPTSIGTSGSTGVSFSNVGSPGGWVNPPRLQDSEHAVALSESFFTTLCLLVTELPPPPPRSAGDNEAMRLNMRRELLHALAAAPRSHSEAMAAAAGAMTRRDENDGSTGGAGSGGSTFREVFSSVLREIGKQKNPGSSRAASAPPTFELRAECSDEYDPTFFHLRRHEHQHAMDSVARLRKQKLLAEGDKKSGGTAKCLPLVSAPPLAHPRFIPCRLLLHLPPMDAALRRALLFALTGGQWLPPPEPVTLMIDDDDEDIASSDVDVDSSTKIGERYATSTSPIQVSSFARRNFNRQSSSSFNKRSSDGSGGSPPFSAAAVAASSVSFIEVIQVLTLQVFTLEECASLHLTQPGLDPESRALSSGLSISSYLERLIQVPDTLTNVWALRPFPDGPLPSRGSGTNRGSILGLIVALYEHRSDHGNDSSGVSSDSGHGDDGHGGARALAADGLKWLIRFVNALVDGATTVKAACESATNGVRVVQDGDDSNEKMSVVENNDGSSWIIEPEIRSSIASMLSNLVDLWPKKVDPSATSTGSSGGMSAKSREARKAAQLRAMERMKKQQANFAASLASQDEGKGDSGVVRKLDLNVEEEGEDEDLCIICRCDDADGENNGPLGFLGHVQRSRSLQIRAINESRASNHNSEQNLTNAYRVVGDRGCQLRATEAMDSATVVCVPTGSIVKVTSTKILPKYDILSRRVFVQYMLNGKPFEGWASVQSSQGYVILSPLVDICYQNSRWGSTRPIVKQCGHAAHMRCVETHCLSLHQRAAGEQPYDGRFAANIDDGEFLCPLCKQLSNVLVPRYSHRAGAKAPTRDTATLPISSVTTTSGIGSEIEVTAILPSAFRDTTSLRRLFVAGASMDFSSVDAEEEKGWKATRQYGFQLLQAMDTPWERTTAAKKRQQRKWNRALHRWDFEEDDSDTPGVGSILRIFRQQHIAWSAIGHSAAAAEASTRGIERQNVVTGANASQASDPWIDYSTETRDSHPMVLELRRILSATSSLLKVLSYEIGKELLTKEDKEQMSKVDIMGRLLADIFVGQFWTSAISPDLQNDSPELLMEWSAVTAFLSSMPCHVARDGMLSQRHEARATAAAMWAVKGASTIPSSGTAMASVHSADGAQPDFVSRAASSESMEISAPVPKSSSIDKLPPMPFAVRQICETGQDFPKSIEAKFFLRSWGTMDPTSTSRTLDSAFRPAVASAFMYTPLLAWDLNTLAGAGFATILAGDSSSQLPDIDDILFLLHLLLTGRMIQVLITPNGWNNNDSEEEDTVIDGLRDWSEEQVKREGESLLKLCLHCHDSIDSSSKNDSICQQAKDMGPRRLLVNVGRAILPYARSLVLILRASSSELRQRQRLNRTGDKAITASSKFLESVIENGEVMSIEDGFQVVQMLGTPLPSDICLPSLATDASSSFAWMPLVDKWLSAIVGFEAHHGSKGRRIRIEGVAAQRTTPTSIMTNFGSNKDDKSLNTTFDTARSEPSQGSIGDPHAGQAGLSEDDAINLNDSSSIEDDNGDDEEDYDYEEFEDEAMADHEGAMEVVQFLADGAMAEDSDEENMDVDGDIEEETIGFEDRLGGANAFFDRQAGLPIAAAESKDDYDEASDDNTSSASSPTDPSAAQLDREFAYVSQSAIVPYQPSVLGSEGIGPGPRGAALDYSLAGSLMYDLSHLGIVHQKGSPNSGLIRLPRSFVELYSLVNRLKGRDNTAALDESDDIGSSETAICLLTGTMMKSGSSRRAFSRPARPPGTCTLHARRTGSGIGVFFLVQKCTVLLMHNNKSAYSASLYVDEHGEEDPGLRRGRPLFLNEARLRVLENLWWQQGIPREVAQIRSTSDRVIRDNWY